MQEFKIAYLSLAKSDEELGKHFQEQAKRATRQEEKDYFNSRAKHFFDRAKSWREAVQ